MSDCLDYLDLAIEQGHKEKDFLAAGLVDEVESRAKSRGELIAKALADIGGETGSVLIEKLNQLRTQQVWLEEEAKRLHAALRADLIRARQEAKRFAGYNQKKNIMPLINDYIGMNRQG